MYKSTSYSLAIVFITIINTLLLTTYVDCTARSDIILAKGKLIVRGRGKNEGSIILDTGGHSSMPMPMMPSFNPYSFYPMQHEHQSHEPKIVIKPIYIEDHSAMHYGGQPKHHTIEVPHYEQPKQEEQSHQEEHQEEQPEYHHQEMPMMEHHQGESEQGSSEGEEHQGGGQMGGYENHPMMAAMMMHGSGPQPAYHQREIHAIPSDSLLAQQLQAQQMQQAQAMAEQHQLQQLHQIQQHQQHQPQQEQQLQQASNSPLTTSSSSPDKTTQNAPSQQQQQQPQPQKSKLGALFEQSANNPLVAIIKPLFKRNPDKDKKPSVATQSSATH